MSTDHRKPIPPAANAIIDCARMCLTNQQNLLREIIKGGLSDAEIYRRIALITDLSYQALQELSKAQSIGVKNNGYALENSTN